MVNKVCIKCNCEMDADIEDKKVFPICGNCIDESLMRFKGRFTFRKNK